MVGTFLKVGLSAAALLAFVFEVFLKDPIWLGLGIGKTPQPISDFPYTCRSIVDSRMEACEDMWLSESTRQLFLACSDPLARPYWMPNVAHFNLSARSQKDAIVVLDIDKPLDDEFQLRSLQTPGFTGTAGDGRLDLVGFAGIENPEDRSIRLFIINHRPSVDAETGEFLNHAVFGANSTVELFETGSDASELKHRHTYASQHIATPNRVAALGPDSFYVTNDHGPNKLGLKHHLSPFLGTGDVTFCDKEHGCKSVAGGLKFPNGLVHGHDGLVYVPNSMIGTISVFRRLENNDIEKVEEIPVGYSIDNLSVDQNGDVYVAAFPRGIDIFKAYEDPYNARPAAAALRLRKLDIGYVLDKVIEDGLGEKLPATTTVIHDAKTGRLFMSSVISPFIAVCEPRK
ncbi:hypothetical protein B0T10DRAFT_488086 [Thelonectria olida]|uniref:Serum paraoxonase/arylesterase n=1 Tax=Thelonectria olida TaxID=1576542 RepID=A0A9P9APM2_9HYPO|nr:hypothetical protein B0T10DRAFT_488086 [Thelonectria olida]